MPPKNTKAELPASNEASPSMIIDPNLAEDMARAEHPLRQLAATANSLGLPEDANAYTQRASLEGIRAGRQHVQAEMARVALLDNQLSGYSPRTTPTQYRIEPVYPARFTPYRGPN
jgi:hypothetical protein